MPPHDDKRLLRNLKRAIKRSGNKRRRNSLKQQLRDNPEDAHLAEEDLGKKVSKDMNQLERPADGSD